MWEDFLVNFSYIKGYNCAIPIEGYNCAIPLAISDKKHDSVLSKNDKTVLNKDL